MLSITQLLQKKTICMEIPILVITNIRNFTLAFLQLDSFNNVDTRVLGDCYLISGHHYLKEQLYLPMWKRKKKTYKKDKKRSETASKVLHIS